MQYTIEIYEDDGSPEWINIECIHIDDTIIDTDKFTNYLTVMVNLYLDNQDEQLLDKVDKFLEDLKK